MAIDIVNETTGEIVRADIPVNARELGIAVKPIIRLGMGRQGEQGEQAIIKTDYFTVRGDDRAVAKFYAVKGEKPKAVTLRLPAEFSRALDIRYVAFKGAGRGKPGVLVARGHTNFATRGYYGGPDTLTLYGQDGTVSEVETEGIAPTAKEHLDEIGRDLKLEIATTLTAGLPEVLGWGSTFQITTHGKESTANLWLKLQELYGVFGSRVVFAVKPELVLRPSTAHPVVTKDGEKKRITTSIFVLDIVIPESDDEMFERLQARQALLGSPVAALYGVDLSEPQALRAAPEPSQDPDGPGSPHSAKLEEAASTDGATSAASSPEPEDGVWEAVDDTPEVDEAAVEKAAQSTVRGTVYDGQTFAEIATDADGPTWFLRQLKKTPADSPGRAALDLFVSVRLPDVWAKYQDAKEAA